MKVTMTYLAGLFDGEGSINITPRYSNDQRRGNLYLQISLGNTDKRACQMFANEFGGGIYLNKPGTDRHLPYWIWVTNTGRASRGLIAMLPHLVLKRRQAKIALAFARHVSQFQGQRITEQSAAFRHRCRNRLIALHGYASRVKNRDPLVKPSL